MLVKGWPLPYSDDEFHSDDGLVHFMRPYAHLIAQNVRLLTYNLTFFGLIIYSTFTVPLLTTRQSGSG